MMLMASQSLWTVEDVARYLSCSTHSVRHYIVRHGLPVLHMGRLLRFDPSQVKDWLLKGQPTNGAHDPIQLSFVFDDPSADAEG